MRWMYFSTFETTDDAFVEGDCEWCEEDAPACEFCGICKLSEDEEDEDV